MNRALHARSREMENIIWLYPVGGVRLFFCKGLDKEFLLVFYIEHYLLCRFYELA